MKKFEITLRQEEITINGYELIKKIVENSTHPKIIDDRLVFFEDGEENTVFNKSEWIFWRRIETEFDGSEI